jgi:hypothetical protein
LYENVPMHGGFTGQAKGTAYLAFYLAFFKRPIAE